MNSRPCTQADCPGAYGPEGYCEVCGSRDPNAAAPQPSTAASGPVTGAASQSTRSSGSQVTRASGSQPFTSTSRSRFGGGMKDIPPVPIRNPSEAILDNAQVPENKRNCANCHKPVGRTGPDGKPGRTQGFCPHCRHRFSFVPSLAQGDMVAGRYEILGAMAHGGLGWIYLARDKNIGDDVAERWVVLKGLIDSSDPDAIDSAIAERRLLAALDHPNIVQIYDFVRHPDPRTNEPLSYIVMEYVPGKSLRDLRKESADENGAPSPLPLSQVLTYLVEILPALGYLHEQGLLFCDFKPDNVIHVESWLKLIDLGAVRRIDDDESAVFGTPGYAVTDDEIINHGPTVSSDLYTVARSAAVLSFDFHSFSRGEFRNKLPTAQTEPLFARYESYRRFLERATDPQPDRRFATAEDMREQLIGVRQEVLSLETAFPHGNSSVLFTPEQRHFGIPDPHTGAFTAPDGPDIATALPYPFVDSDDPSAGFLATLSATDPMDVLYELQTAPENSAEVRLRRVRANIAYGNLKAAGMNLDEYAETGTGDWRITWWRGVIALLSREPVAARDHFDALYGHLPGEVAPMLALAAAWELSDDTTAALGLYSRIWMTDRRYVSAAFGQARLLAAQGHADPAIGVLDAVPASSSQYTTSKVATIALRLGGGEAVSPEAVRDAAHRLTGLDLPEHHHHLLRARILLACLHYVGATPSVPQPPILEHPLEEKALRFGLEDTYRRLARTSSARDDRIHFIDEANKIRPWTMV
ncbi:MAG: tetratricopeptide repeat protein [Stackebrandtia sp.]